MARHVSLMFAGPGKFHVAQPDTLGDLGRWRVQKYHRRVTLSWWLTEPRRPLLAHALDGPPDVVVVGGGVTGCSAALRLARGGLRVRLHEAREIAGGASGRNGGFALRGGAMPYDRAREWLGAEQAASYWRATETALDRMAAVAGDALRARGQPSARG